MRVFALPTVVLLLAAAGCGSLRPVWKGTHRARQPEGDADGIPQPYVLKIANVSSQPIALLRPQPDLNSGTLFYNARGELANPPRQWIAQMAKQSFEYSLVTLEPGETHEEEISRTYIAGAYHLLYTDATHIQFAYRPDPWSYMGVPPNSEHLFKRQFVTGKLPL